MLGQQSPSLVQPGLHRALPAADRSSDLAFVEVGVVPENNHDPQMCRQILKSADQILSRCDTAWTIFDCRYRNETVIR
jgi:hypothetical protein